MDDYFLYDPLSAGSKGAVFVGDKVLVYRRTHDAPVNPGELDFPGGGPEGEESPFQTFQRELLEEFGLKIEPEYVVFSRRYPSKLRPGKFGWHAVAKLPASEEKNIVFGDEGEVFWLMPIEEFMDHPRATQFLKDRTADYLATL